MVIGYVCNNCQLQLDRWANGDSSEMYSTVNDELFKFAISILYIISYG